MGTILTKQVAWCYAFPQAKKKLPITHAVIQAN